jgi:molecular chaperone GrpE (heat shock protein)
MQDNISELECIITENLKNVNALKYDIERKELEKHDLFIEMIKKIIEVIDSFERIEENSKESRLDKNIDVSQTMNRYKTIERRLLNLLANYQITKMEFPNGRLVVGWCEVVGTEPDNRRQNEEIITIVKNGYARFNKDIIRAAQVIIIKN